MTKHPVTGTEHDGLCENCDAPLTIENLHEGNLGFYCSLSCCEEAESGSFDEGREDFHSDG